MDLDRWPAVRTYRGADLAHIAMPVGGIGTGCISLSGRGQLVDWELFNRPASGFCPESFFCVRVDDGQAVHTRVLEGALDVSEYDGSWGSTTTLAGLPRFRQAEFQAAYPFGRVELRDPDMPVEATVGAFNPLVPGDAEASGVPALVYRVAIRNVSHEVVSVDLGGNLVNVAGYDPQHGVPANSSFETVPVDDTSVLLGRTGAVPSDHEGWGTVALSCLDAEVSSYRHNWESLSWGDSLLDYWDDFADDGRLHQPEKGARVPTGSLVTSRSIPPGETVQTTFVVTWHFPNRRAWTHHFQGPPNYGYGDHIVGNHYTERFTDAADVVSYLIPRIGHYEEQTLDFVRAVTGSSLPTPVQEATLSNLAVLKSPTCLRIADGTFLAWEGCNRDHGSCHGSCTHVWNYQYALEQLFPELAWSMRDVEFVHALDDRGLMSFRVGLPFESEGTGWQVAAADGQMGALVRLHRTWRLTGDDQHLQKLWPAARRAMEFAWIPLGWDADRDGLMEGCQHNTADVEYYGPSGVIQSWYLAALSACADMAIVADDEEFAKTCDDLLRRGAEATSRRLFNGEYYQQEVIPAGTEDRIAQGLRIRYTGGNPDVGSDDLHNPDLQIAAGCTSDQLAGHAMAQLGGLDDHLDVEETRTAMRNVVRHNHRAEFYSHFNHLRTFALNDEHGLLNCTYPHGGRPTRPFPYCNEVWSGWEYTAAVCLALQGDREQSAHVVEDVRGRYTGGARNPFNEVECGNHYVRSMASFGLLHAWPRIVVDRGAGRIEIDPLEGRWPVVVGRDVGVVQVDRSQEGTTATYTPVLGGGDLSVHLRES